MSNEYCVGDATVITSGFGITEADERLAELVMLRKENAALRAFVAAYDADAEPQASTYATRQAVRAAREAIK